MALRRLLPLLDRVLIERVIPATKTAGGVLLPESAAPKMNEGTVMAVGPGRRNPAGELVPMGVKAGDKVMLPEYGGQPVKLGQAAEKEMFLYRDEELLGLLSDN
ncbi:hypothetical protein FOA52_014601 [Chlamydomonas sp. UWO 241]|nr:hypothetical protein FOA52_014601 [Chlamydomonas sp. UWO 241]